jgi:hypothetical protein
VRRSPAIVVLVSSRGPRPPSSSPRRPRSRSASDLVGEVVVALGELLEALDKAAEEDAA